MEVGSLALVTTESSPPMARITQLHPGKDGLTRVVTVKTASITFQRPVAKLVLLPVYSRTNDQHNG